LLLMQADSGKTAFWSTYDWATNGRAVAGVGGVAASPQYVIEQLPRSRPRTTAAEGEVDGRGFFHHRTPSAATDAVAILRPPPPLSGNSRVRYRAQKRQLVKYGHKVGTLAGVMVGSGRVSRPLRRQHREQAPVPAGRWRR
jgi:hypothetical protein